MPSGLVDFVRIETCLYVMFDVGWYCLDGTSVSVLVFLTKMRIFLHESWCCCPLSPPCPQVSPLSLSKIQQQGDPFKMTCFKVFLWDRGSPMHQDMHLFTLPSWWQVLPRHSQGRCGGTLWIAEPHGNGYCRWSRTGEDVALVPMFHFVGRDMAHCGISRRRYTLWIFVAYNVRRY